MSAGVHGGGERVRGGGTSGAGLMTSDFKSERGVVDMIDSTGGEAAGSVTNEESSGRPCRCCFDVPRQP